MPTQDNPQAALAGGTRPKRKRHTFVCPWWGGYFIDNPLRRLLHNPEAILGRFVGPAMTVMDVGCGMGYFAIAMAKRVGDQGRVIAVDLQQPMLDVLRRRAERAGVADRIEVHRCESNRLGVHVQADFALAFAMLHEVPDQQRLLGEIHACLKPGGRLLVAEPRLHVSGRAFRRSVAWGEEVGLGVVPEEPLVRWFRAAVFRKQ